MTTCPHVVTSPDGTSHCALAETGGRAAAEAEAEGRAKDAAYTERNRLVAVLARLYPSGIARTAIPGWDPEWHGCVYIDLPTGQASWHFHDSDAHLFDGLPPYAKPWDGHTTEEKYERLAALYATAMDGRAAHDAGFRAGVEAARLVVKQVADKWSELVESARRSGREDVAMRREMAADDFANTARIIAALSPAPAPLAPEVVAREGLEPRGCPTPGACSCLNPEILAAVQAVAQLVPFVVGETITPSLDLDEVGARLADVGLVDIPDNETEYWVMTNLGRALLKLAEPQP